MISSLSWIINHPSNKNSFFPTIIRLFIWKLNQLSLKIPVVVEIEKGIKFKCYPDSSWGGLVIYTKLPEYFEMKFVNKIINKKDIVIDVGSNLGSYSLIAASKMSSGKVYAFEPSKIAYKRLLENIKLNNFENKIIPLDLAVSDKKGRISFSETDRSEVSHVSYLQFKQGLKVRSITLDNFVKRQKIKKIRLLKIDVEGYEYKVLKGASEILEKGIVDYLLVEINRDSLLYSIEPSKTINLLKQYRYNIYFFPNSSQLTPISKYGGTKKTINMIGIHKDIQRK